MNHRVPMQEPPKTGLPAAHSRLRQRSEVTRDDQADNAAPSFAALSSNKEFVHRA